MVGWVSGDVLEYLWGLGFAKEARGEVVECLLPLDYHIWGHSLVEWYLVKA